MNNSVFGKAIENMKQRIDMKFIKTEIKNPILKTLKYILRT